MRPGTPSTSPPSPTPAAVTWTTYLTSYLGPRYSSQSPPPIPAPVLLSREEQKLLTPGSTPCFCLPALFRKLKILTICMANTMLSLRDTGQAGSWCLGSTQRKSEHGLGSGKALIHRPPAVALSPRSSCPSLESCCC